MSWGHGRRLASGGVAAVVAALLVFAPSGTASAEGLPAAGGVAAQVGSPDSTGIVPNVLDRPRTLAVNAVRAAGFVAQTSPGSFDCGPPYVQQQFPDGGTSAPLGSTVFLDISRQPRPDDCP